MQTLALHQAMCDQIRESIQIQASDSQSWLGLAGTPAHLALHHPTFLSEGLEFPEARDLVASIPYPIPLDGFWNITKA